MPHRLLTLALPCALALAACERQPEPPPPAPAASSSAPVLTRQSIDSAGFEAAPASGSQARSAGLARAQVLLDRARFSPGVVDGLGGENTRQAILAFQEANELNATGELDQATFDRLVSGDSQPALTDHVLTTEDVAGPFVDAIPEDMEGKAELETLAYTSPQEALAERFHMDQDFLTELNPNARFVAGETITVAAVSPQELPQAVARIEIDKADKSLRAFAENGDLLAYYPASIGSAEMPSLSGSMTVRAVAPRPNYTYDPSRLTNAEGDETLIIQPGPNNPIGAVWIDLSKDTYGIHGTPEPSEIGKTFSSGCVRLTNWNARQLANSVEPGVEVVFL
ncbi:L,D-transpeptidase family protein [Brevundimonas lutea]|uniref:L,D-transpeptidase family protein n=1 Tax=Brevundimonas lutea TaxID=2293980 RepID=UPI000F03296F|nr:L,D-transpeptidase [Brevundimonas lutea]